MTDEEEIQLHKHILMLWDKSVSEEAGFYPIQIGPNEYTPVTMFRIYTISMSRKLHIIGLKSGKLKITITQVI